MVNSGSFDSDVDRNEKDGFTPSDRVAESPQSAIPMHAVAGSLCENDFATQTADSLPVSQAIEPTATKTEYKCNMSELFVGANGLLTSKDNGASLGYIHKTLTASAGVATPVIARDHEQKHVANCLGLGLEVQSNGSEPRTKPSVCCSVPLEKVQDVLKACAFRNKQLLALQSPKQTTKKDMCLYCDRTFITSSLKQKHVDRSHSSKHNRRLSARRQVAKQSLTVCMFCEKLNGSECTLKQLFEHLASEHPRKYFGCLDCEVRFPSLQTFQNHNIKVHGRAKDLPEEEDLEAKVQKDGADPDKLSIDVSEKVNGSRKNIKPIDSNAEPKTERLKAATKKPKAGNPNSARNGLQSNPNNRLYVKIKNKCKSRNSIERKEEQEKDKSSQPSVISSESEQISPGKTSDDEKVPVKGKSKANWAKELRSKKISVLSTKVGLKQGLRTTRQRTKILENAKNSKRKIANNKIERTAGTTNVTTKYLPYTHNPYPSFDFSFRVKKITDHSIDNIRISSMTFDDVFDKAFFNRVKSNIQENLLHYIDGKLFKSVESENRISSFQKTKDDQADEASQNCGSKISSNAITPVAALLTTTQFGEDLESQIEYGAKPSKKKTVVNDEVHYKYFTRRKYQAVISESREHRDLSKLDMWTQLVVKNRQQKISSENKTDKEILEYTKSDEYKVKMQVEELNTILDKRGPLEDLKEEAIRTVALEKLNGTIIDTHIESYFDVTIILDELLNGLFSAESCSDTAREDTESISVSLDSDERDSESPLKCEEIPNMLNLRRVSCVPQDRPVENSLDNDTDETAIAELTGEWARSRIYVCAACGMKMPNAKSLIDHKNLFHEHVWCQHYEFVGNQGELYRHLSIPALGKIGEVEESSGSKMWRRSDSRVCSKCNKRTNCLGDLHRHILECGGDWSWMLARKKYKYRPYGSRPRKKKRGLLRFLHTFRERKADQARDKRNVIKKYTGPRQKPSDADTIQRMLANLPAKRITRKVVSMKDGFQRSLKNQKISKANKSKPLRKQKLGSDKTASKPLQKNQGGIKNANKPRRVLRSNSAVRFEVNMILPKFKKEVKGNNTSNLQIKRHSVRNINKVLPNKIRKSTAVKTRSKLADKQEEVGGIDSAVDDLKKDIELSIENPPQNAANETVNSTKKGKVIKLKKKSNKLNAKKVKSVKKGVANVSLESGSEDFKPIENDTVAIATEEDVPTIPETILTNTVLQKSDLDAVVCPSHTNKKSIQHEYTTAPVIKETQEQKKSPKVKTRQRNSYSNEGDISSNQPELQQNPENQFPVLTITKPLVPKSTKKKKIKKKPKLVFEIKADSSETKDASKDALNGVQPQPQEQDANKIAVASVRTSCRKKARISKKPAIPSLKIATKKMKSSRIKKKITKIVQVDGSSQSTPSTRSKSTKKEFFSSVFLHASNDHMILPSNTLQITTDLSDLSTLDTTTATPTANKSSECCLETNASHIDEALAVIAENDLENKINDITIPDKVVEAEEAPNDKNKSSIILDSSLNLPDTKEQSILAPRNPPIATVTPTAKKKSTKKLRGLNDCIAMLTNKLQDKVCFHTSSSDNAIPVIPAVEEMPIKAALIHSDILPKNYEWKNDFETNSTFQNGNDTVTKVFTESLSKPIETMEDAGKIDGILSTTSTYIQNEKPITTVAKNNEIECNSKLDIHNNLTVKLNLIEFLPLEKFSMEQFSKNRLTNNHSVIPEYSVDELVNESNNHITLKISSIMNDHNLFAINKTKEYNTLLKENVGECITTAQPNEVYHETKLDEMEETSAKAIIEDTSAKQSPADIQHGVDTGNIFEKEFNKTIDVTVKKTKSLKAKTTFGQNCNADNILQLQSNAPAKPKKSVCKKAKVSQKQKKKKSRVNKSLKSNYVEFNKRKNNLQQLEFIDDTEIFSDSAQNLSESRIEISDSISDMKLVQNLDNDQEALLNTSDEFSNSGKENLIINKIVKVSKHKKSKTAKTKKSQTKPTKKSKKLSTEKKCQKNVTLLKLPKEDTQSNPIENTTNISDPSEFIDSEDDIPLAQFINKPANCTPVTQSKSDAISPDIQLVCEPITIDEVKENLCESQEHEPVKEVTSSMPQYEESSAKSVDDKDAHKVTTKNGLLPEVMCLTKESQLHQSRKLGELRVIVQLTNLKNIRKKLPKISVNKVKKQKKFTKHRKRKNADITLTDDKEEKTLILSDNVVPDANKVSVEGHIITDNDDESILKVQAIEKDECGTKSAIEDSSVLPNEVISVGNYSADNDFLSTCSSSEIFNNILGKESPNFTKAEEKTRCNTAGDGMIEEEQVKSISSNEYANLVTETIESLNVDESENTTEQLPQETIKEVNEGNLKATVEAPSVKAKSKSKANSKSKSVKARTSKSRDPRNAVNVFCNICNKTFTRTENLVKHKRTLTHIAKLSELEALEAVKKAQEEITVIESFSEENASHKNGSIQSKCDLNISDILCTADTVEHNAYPQSTSLPSSFAMAATQDSLKLVDIINDVLSKPVEDDYLKHNNFSNLILKSDLEVKRCKSLGERKSFDCDKLQLLSNSSASPTHDLSLDSNFVTSKIPSTADVIVEKQISLLENMIEDNRINFNPNDKVFISSELPINEEYSSQSNSSEFSILSSSKPEDCNEITFTHNTNIITNLIKPTLDEDNLIQSTQYEEISEDSSSSHFQFEEQKSRKALNRDEELFLECCSLLKSSSDVSDLCKKSSKSTQFLNNFGLKPLDEIEWLEQKQLPPKNVDYDQASNIVLEDSHINDSIDDNFCNDMSYSNSSTSNCNLNMKALLDRNKNDHLFSQPPIFEDISAESEDSSAKSLSDCFKNFGSISSATNGPSVVEDGTKGDERSSPSVESAQIPEEYKASEEIGEEKRTIILKLGNTKSKTVKSKPSSEVQDLEDLKTSTSKPTQSCITDYAVPKKTKKGERKMLTKGAMKVFEGLKVSIPKEGLDMKEVLSCSPTSKRLELEAEQESANINKKESENVNKKVSSEKQKAIKPVFHKTINNNVGSKKTVLKKLGNKLGLKIKKKCQPHRKNAPSLKDSLGDNAKKSHDIYDFEETQDSIDVFATAKHSNSLPIYHSFRNKFSNKSTDESKTASAEKELEFQQYNDVDEANSNCEDSTDLDNTNTGEKPSSPVVASSTKKINNHKSITKKKCMIMGRIFKNAIKSKTVDEIKNIPVIENSQKVEDYVQNCHGVETKPDGVSAEHKLSEEEMNILFDNLLNDERPKEGPDKNKDRNSETGEQEPVVATSLLVKNAENKLKLKGSKCKKRQRGNSCDSSDEEFSIKKAPKKHCSRKNSSNNECVINLEQELKECIGVASRKSQRKCTSGKQNVLVEYWSSDESSFDIIEPNEVPVESPKNIQGTPVESAPTTFSDFSTTSQNYCNDNVITIDKEQEGTEPIVLPLDTNTYDTNSTNLKKKQTWSELPLPPKPLSAHNKKKGMPKIKKGETGGTDREAADSQAIALRRQKRTAVDTLYYWSSSSEDELQDVIEVKPIREEYDDEDRPLQQGWIVGDSPKKLVTMLAQAKGKKVDAECVKKNRKKRTSI